MGSDYSHLRTVPYKDTRGKPATAILELGPDGHVYLKDNGRYRGTEHSKREITNATNSELIEILRPSLGLPPRLYQNRRSHRR